MCVCNNGEWNIVGEQEEEEQGTISPEIQILLNVGSGITILGSGIQTTIIGGNYIQGATVLNSLIKTSTILNSRLNGLLAYEQSKLGKIIFENASMTIGTGILMGDLVGIKYKDNAISLGTYFPLSNFFSTIITLGTINEDKMTIITPSGATRYITFDT